MILISFTSYMEIFAVKLLADFHNYCWTHSLGCCLLAPLNMCNQKDIRLFILLLYFTTELPQCWQTIHSFNICIDTLSLSVCDKIMLNWPALQFKMQSVHISVTQCKHLAHVYRFSNILLNDKNNCHIGYYHSDTK